MSWNTEELFDELDSAGFAVSSIASHDGTLEIEFYVITGARIEGETWASTRIPDAATLAAIKARLERLGCQINEPKGCKLYGPDCFECGTKEEPAGRKDDGVPNGTPKPMFRLMPPLAEEEVAKVLTHGALKYGPENWRDVENAQDRYLDAALRHINARRQGKRTDEDSGLRAIAHAICSLYFLLELDLEENP